MRSDQEQQLIALQPVLRRMARRFCPRDKFVQEEFIQMMNESIIRHFDTIKDKKLLVLAAKLDAIDDIRRSGNLFRYRNRAIQLVYEIDNLTSDHNYDEVVDSIVLGDAIRSIYPTLNSTERYVINLFLLGYNQSEIARLLGRSDGLISVALKRVKEAIKQCVYPD